jgi:hypothetical protein
MVQGVQTLAISRKFRLKRSHPLEAANIYYDTQGMTTPMMKYQRGNFLVFDDEFKNLTTYMRQLHEYYMA